MKTKLFTTALAATFISTSVHGQTMTPDSVKTRIGDLEFEQEFPTEEPARKMFDEMDYARGAGLPLGLSGGLVRVIPPWRPARPRR